MKTEDERHFCLFAFHDRRLPRRDPSENRTPSS